MLDIYFMHEMGGWVMRFICVAMLDGSDYVAQFTHHF